MSKANLFCLPFTYSSEHGCNQVRPERFCSYLVFQMKCMVASEKRDGEVLLFYLLKSILRDPNVIDLHFIVLSWTRMILNLNFFPPKAYSILHFPSMIIRKRKGRKKERNTVNLFGNKLKWLGLLTVTHSATRLVLQSFLSKQMTV